MRIPWLPKGICPIVVLTLTITSTTVAASKDKFNSMNHLPMGNNGTVANSRRTWRQEDGGATSAAGEAIGQVSTLLTSLFEGLSVFPLATVNVLKPVADAFASQVRLNGNRTQQQQQLQPQFLPHQPQGQQQQQYYVIPAQQYAQLQQQQQQPQQQQQQQIYQPQPQPIYQQQPQQQQYVPQEQAPQQQQEYYPEEQQQQQIQAPQRQPISQSQQNYPTRLETGQQQEFQSQPNPRPTKQRQPNPNRQRATTRPPQRYRPRPRPPPPQPPAPPPPPPQQISNVPEDFGQSQGPLSTGGLGPIGGVDDEYDANQFQPSRNRPSSPNRRRPPPQPSEGGPSESKEPAFPNFGGAISNIFSGAGELLGVGGGGGDGGEDGDGGDD